jgi:hypothetical protein
MIRMRWALAVRCWKQQSVRLPRVGVMIAADLWRMALAGLLPLVDQHLVAVYAVTFGLAAGGVFFNPAASSASAPRGSGCCLASLASAPRSVSGRMPTRMARPTRAPSVIPCRSDSDAARDRDQYLRPPCADLEDQATQGRRKGGKRHGRSRRRPRLASQQRADETHDLQRRREAYEEAGRHLARGRSGPAGRGSSGGRP